MKLGFDSKRAVQNNTGLGNYSRYVIEILAHFYPSNDYLLFAPKRKENPRLRPLQAFKNIRFVFPSGIWKRISGIWRISAMKGEIRRSGVDIFHGLSNELPIGSHKTGVKTVVTIHDLIFIRYPEYYKPIDRLIYYQKFSYACRIAHKIIAVSECTKRDIVSYFRIPEDKIEVVYQGCHPDFKEKAPAGRRDEVSRLYQLPPQYLLYVGSIEARKNLMLVVKALLDVNPDIHLVAVGRRTAYQDKIARFVEENHLSSRVHILNGVPFEHLPALYQGARVFVYPSFFEGFGIPVIEALSSGVPVIAATGSCLEEAGGEYSCYIHPENANELSVAIERIVNDPERSRLMIEKGKEYVKRFDDEVIAGEIMRVYQSL